MTKQTTLEALKKGDEEALQEIYISNREPFINYALKFNLDRDEILDVYQDAIIALQENIVSGKLSSLSSSIKTYLFGIGKYKIYEKIRKQSKLTLVEENTLKEEEYDLDLHEDAPSEQQILLKEGFSMLGDRCKRILELFYYRGYTIDEIRVSENYENNNTVKSQKSRCLKSLRQAVLNPTN
ncbi:hypothetical protein GCM10009117_20430 [Gangjinia marincola]|uniref:Sigma-70 family RNA polymerase sigma factor n=1 Tax=Gangjinia marincola TaxID=578463 RepID=A0ABN1MI55_9FLAO